MIDCELFERYNCCMLIGKCNALFYNNALMTNNDIVEVSYRNEFKFPSNWKNLNDIYDILVPEYPEPYSREFNFNVNKVIDINTDVYKDLFIINIKFDGYTFTSNPFKGALNKERFKINLITLFQK